jgi:hypothetical protein
MTGHLIKLVKNNINVKPLCDRVEKEPELWKENTWRQDYVVKLDRPISPQQDTEAIMFRWAPHNTIVSVRDSLDIVNHPNLVLLTEIQPLISECFKAAEATELGRVFITKLKPGGKVLPHSDYGMYSDHFERFHLVLTSDPGNRFYVHQESSGWQESYYMKPGEFFWFNHKEIHWVHNDSKTPRMHIIIDCVSPKYRKERISVQS